MIILVLIKVNHLMNSYLANNGLSFGNYLASSMDTKTSKNIEGYSNYLKKNHTRQKELSKSYLILLLIFANISVAITSISKSSNNDSYINAHQGLASTEKTSWGFLSSSPINFIRSFNSNEPLYLTSYLERINDLSKYEVGWDGEDSVGASKETISDAKKLASLLASKNIKIPFITMAGDGEILFLWESKFNLDIGVDGEGTYSYYFSDLQTGEEALANEKSIDNILEDTIIAKIIG